MDTYQTGTDVANAVANAVTNADADVAVGVADSPADVRERNIRESMRQRVLLEAKTMKRYGVLDVVWVAITIPLLAVYWREEQRKMIPIWVAVCIGVNVIGRIIQVVQFRRKYRRLVEGVSPSPGDRVTDQWLMASLVFTLLFSLGWRIYGSMLFFEDVSFSPLGIWMFIQLLFFYVLALIVGLASCATCCCLCCYVCVRLVSEGAGASPDAGNIDMGRIIHMAFGASRPGLLEEQVAEIPVSTYQAPAPAPAPGPATDPTTAPAPAKAECSICLSELLPGETVHHLKCNHIFHRECTSRWFLEHASCPNCRASVSV